MIILNGLFWLIVIIITFLGEFTTLISNQIGLHRGLDMIFSILIAIVIYFIYSTNQQINKLNKDIAKVNKLIDEKNNKK